MTINEQTSCKSGGENELPLIPCAIHAMQRLENDTIRQVQKLRIWATTFEYPEYLDNRRGNSESS